MPAFTLDATPTAREVFPGENATYAIRVGNPAVIERQAQMNVTSLLPPDWTWGFSVDPVPLAANASGNTTLTIHVPAHASAQTLTITYEARDQWNFTRANVTITVKERPTTTPPAPLPAPALRLAVSAGDSGEAGATIQGDLTVTNDDTLRPSVTIQVAPVARDGWSPYVRDADRNRVLGSGASAKIPLYVEVPDIGEDATIEFDITVTAAGHIYTTKWTVRGIASSSETIVTDPATPTDGAPTSGTGGTTTGGTSTRTPTIGVGPNLAVLVEPLEITIPSGGTQTALVRIENTGGTALAVRLEGTPPSQWRPFTFEPDVPVSLAPGERAEIVITLAAPEGLPPGGSTQGKVTAISDNGIVRSAQFLITVTPAAPRDESRAATIEAPSTPDGALPVSGTLALTAVGLAAVGAGAAALMSRPLREKLLWGAAGLYTRLARPDVLGHEDREKLYRLVETQPGIHFHALQRELGWNTGTLTYHVRVLERHGFVVSRRDGLYRRFYLSGAAPRKETFENQGPTGLRADVLEAVRNAPGISQSDLALGLGANKQTVNYHVKALERAGTIRVEKRGRDTFLYTSDAPAGTDGETARV